MKLQNAITIRVEDVSINEELEFLKHHWIDYDLFTIEGSNNVYLIEINIFHLNLMGMLNSIEYLSKRYDINISLLKHSDYIHIVGKK